MKLPLDENLPHDLRKVLLGHEVFTVAFMGWAGIRNGALLRLAAQNGFDAVVSLDSGIEFEQNLKVLACSVVILNAPSNRMRHILPLVPSLLVALESLPVRTLVRVDR